MQPLVKNNFSDILRAEDQVNVKYVNRYIDFINRCRYDHSLEEYTEIHHILPKAIFKEYKICDWNLIRLSAREHFIAHWILSKVFVDKRKHAATKAWHFMTVSRTNKRYFNSRAYAYCRKNLSDSMKEHNPAKNADTIKKMSNSQKALWTDEKRLAQSIARKGVNYLTPEGIDKLRKLWDGVKRPKKEGQVEKNRKNASSGLFITPFGVFYSPGQASLSEANIDKLSRFVINKKCKENIDGFTFTSFGKEEKRGKWKRS